MIPSPSKKDEYKKIYTEARPNLLKLAKELYIEEDPIRIEQIRRELLDYCELDTLATLESLRAIRKINLMNN